MNPSDSARAGTMRCPPVTTDAISPYSSRSASAGTGSTAGRRNARPKARENVGVQGNPGDYLVFYAAGYADGRKTTAEKSASMASDSVTGDLPSELATTLNNTFTAPANPCATREVQCTP